MLVILGNQLFAPQHLPRPGECRIFMAEDRGLCTYEKHHQQKLVLFLAAMRAYADELTGAGYDVHYVSLDEDPGSSYTVKLAAALEASGAEELVHFEIEDRPMERRIIDFAAERKLRRRELASPMFLCSREDFAGFARGDRPLRMADFYSRQRRRLGILVDGDGNPAGGRWSFDADNRRKLPRNITPPGIRWPAPDEHVAEVIRLVARDFATHPGSAAEFRWPTTRAQARTWLADFLDQRLDLFGPYEDALTTRSETVYHSLLTPVLNLGLLTPREVVDAALARFDRVPLQSLEGFIRQVIGWREFVRGVYRTCGERQAEANFWSHERELAPAWYRGETGLPPLDDTIRSVLRLGWTHHIPRLMVLGNLMTLCEIRPHSAYRWFMEMYIDSSEWVMGPNIYGMGLFSDGGIFATKPYICGSNYLLKMSDYRKGPWCDIVDGLYWRFIDKHRRFFESNPRLALMPKALDRLETGRRDGIFAAAENFLEEYTI